MIRLSPICLAENIGSQSATKSGSRMVDDLRSATAAWLSSTRSTLPARSGPPPTKWDGRTGTRLVTSRTPSGPSGGRSSPAPAVATTAAAPRSRRQPGTSSDATPPSAAGSTAPSSASTAPRSAGPRCEARRQRVHVPRGRRGVRRPRHARPVRRRLHHDQPTRRPERSARLRPRRGRERLLLPDADAGATHEGDRHDRDHPPRYGDVWDALGVGRFSGS